MPKAKKLPSGSWRCQVSAGNDKDGKRTRVSFTGYTKREAELMAAEFLAHKRNAPIKMSIGEAISGYIDARENILSPSTIRSYVSLCGYAYDAIKDIQLDDVNSAVIQTWINSFAKQRSPKTVRNASSLLKASIGMYMPDLHITTTLPQRERKDLYIPSDADVQTLLQYCAGTELETAILLAAFGPLRRGEICALTEADIDRKKNTVSVSKSMVYSKDKVWIVKQPKTYAGYRVVTFPPEIIAKIPKRKKDQRILTYNPVQVSRRFKKALVKCNLPDMRFHALRSYAATIFHALGVIDQRIMERGGWESEYVMKRIYRGSTPDIRKKEDDKIFDHISVLSV